MKGNLYNSSEALYGIQILADSTEKKQSGWIEEEGQLSVDILETEQEIVVISTMAGARDESLEIVIQNDLLTIRGSRISPLHESAQYGRILQHYHKECFWGKFSRTIVLPHDVKSELTTATLQNGVLVIRLPKRQQTSRIQVTVVDD